MNLLTVRFSGGILLKVHNFHWSHIYGKKNVTFICRGLMKIHINHFISDGSIVKFRSLEEECCLFSVYWLLLEGYY